jgi:hypothetical protein
MRNKRSREEIKQGVDENKIMRCGERGDKFLVALIECLESEHLIVNDKDNQCEGYTSAAPSAFGDAF